MPKTIEAKRKYLPATVLAQLDHAMSYLPPSALPVVIVLRASGWRISDVLGLRYDRCLEQRYNAQHNRREYELVGDILKTRVLGHRIPITPEIASLIEAQRTMVQASFTETQNPQKYLFPMKSASGEALPMQQSTIRSALNQLAEKQQIVGEDGAIFHFRTHAFRHTKAVELINGGMPLIFVQQWLAHLSPQMTLVYAKILDDTLRKQWEQVEAKVGVQFVEEQPVLIEGMRLRGVLSNNHFDPLRVREHRVNIKLPVGNCVKPEQFKCRFVELPCFHCPMHVLTDEDLPWLERYAGQLAERIAIGKQANNAHWVQANQTLLDEKVYPTIELLKQGQNVARESPMSREYTPEEWKQRRLLGDERDE